MGKNIFHCRTSSSRYKHFFVEGHAQYRQPLWPTSIGQAFRGSPSRSGVAKRLTVKRNPNIYRIVLPAFFFGWYARAQVETDGATGPQ